MKMNIVKPFYFFIYVVGLFVLAGCEGGGGTSITRFRLIGGSVQEGSLSLEGKVLTFAGKSLAGAQDGAGTAVKFNCPRDITTDGTSLYVADTWNCTIRKIVINTGEATTLAGSAGMFGSTDGTGDAARFYFPYGITTDGTILYVTDTYNHTVRKIVINTGVVTTLVGSAGAYGSVDGTGAEARFGSPQGITTDGSNLYVTDIVNNTIRKITIGTKKVTTLAGSSRIYGSADGTGDAARFCYPFGITATRTNLYIIEMNNAIRSIN